MRGEVPKKKEKKMEKANQVRYHVCTVCLIFFFLYERAVLRKL